MGGIDMKCINCGSEIPYDSVKCPDCGANLQIAAASVNPSQQRDTALTYAALGQKRKFYLKTGPLLMWLIALGVSFLLALADGTALLAATEEESLGGEFPMIMVMSMPIMLLDFVISSIFASKAWKSLRKNEYVSAWKYTEHTMIAFVVLQAIHLGYVVMTATESSNPVPPITVGCIVAAISVAGAVFGKVKASDIGRQIAAAERDEIAGAMRQQTGQTGSKRGMIEENNVKSFNQAVQIGSVSVLLAVIILCCLFIATNHITAALIVLAIGAALVIAAAVKKEKDKSAWKQQGLYIDRDGTYFIRRHRITLKKTDFDEVIEQIKKSDFRNASTHWITKHEGRIRFYGWNNNFEAVLEEAPADEAGQSVLYFHFENLRRQKNVGWNLVGMITAAIKNKINEKTYADVRSYEVYMNLCMTQVEQAIYRLDQNAQIQ